MEGRKAEREGEKLAVKERTLPDRFREGPIVRSNTDRQTDRQTEEEAEVEEEEEEAEEGKRVV